MTPRSGASAREHRSIGEVLETLRDEFPDITISKIRFLESQGLVNPERTPSGYRKFYPEDVERLRWILVQQKDHFLPLKVIRERLAQRDLEAADREPPAPRKRAAKARAKAEAPGEDGPVLVQPTLGIDDGPDDFDAAPSGVSMTRGELLGATGIEESELAALESYGLVEPSTMIAGEPCYDETGLTVARTAGAFMRFGIDARHLRMYRQFAEREVGLFEQVLVAELRKRNPEARARAREEIEELARLGRALRAAYLREAVRGVLSE
ncbi:MAG: MerR family transcriptional regulator [Acidimicrobiia bacterium]